MFLNTVQPSVIFKRYKTSCHRSWIVSGFHKDSNRILILIRVFPLCFEHSVLFLFLFFSFFFLKTQISGLIKIKSKLEYFCSRTDSVEIKLLTAVWILSTHPALCLLPQVWSLPSPCLTLRKCESITTNTALSDQFITLLKQRPAGVSCLIDFWMSYLSHFRDQLEGKWQPLSLFYLLYM